MLFLKSFFFPYFSPLSISFIFHSCWGFSSFLSLKHYYQDTSEIPHDIQLFSYSYSHTDKQKWNILVSFIPSLFFLLYFYLGGSKYWSEYRLQVQLLPTLRRHNFYSFHIFLNIYLFLEILFIDFNIFKKIITITKSVFHLTRQPYCYELFLLSFLISH